MRENQATQKRRLYRLLHSPWKTDQARAATLAFVTGVFFIVVMVISWLLPDDVDMTWWQNLLSIMGLVLVFTVLLFNANVCKNIARNKNIDLVRGFKITGLSFIKWVKTTPLNILVVFDIIGVKDKGKLVEDPDTKNRDYKYYYREFARWYKSSEKQSEKIHCLISEVKALSFPVVTRAVVASKLKKFASMEEFLAEAEDVVKTWGVVILENSLTAEIESGGSILDMLQLLDAYPKNVWRIAAFGIDAVSSDEIAWFMSEAKYVLVYDECEAMKDMEEIPEPLIPTSKLENVTQAIIRSRRKPQYRWHGALPETFIKTAVAYEFLQARVAISTMFKLQERKTLTRLEIVRLLKILSLGRTTISESDFSAQILAEEHKSTALALVTRELQYDSSQNVLVNKVAMMSKEIEDLNSIWQAAMIQSGFEATFVADDKDNEGSSIAETSTLFEEPVGKISKLVGVESYISAYYAGVPISDIIV